jgi:hypothetical protein
MKSADAVVDSDGTLWELQGPVREDLSLGKGCTGKRGR